MEGVYAFIDSKWQLLRANQIVAYNKFKKYKSKTMQTQGSSSLQNVYYTIDFTDNDIYTYNFIFSEENDDIYLNPVYIQLNDTNYHKILDLSSININTDKNIKEEKYFNTSPNSLQGAVRAPTSGGSFRNKYNKTKKTKKTKK